MQTKDVLKDLPEKQRFVIPMEAKGIKEYEEANKDFILWLSKNAPGRAGKSAKADGLVKLGYLKRLAARLKLSTVFEWVDNFLAENEGKIILFAIHKKIVEELHKRYQKISVVLDGSTPNKKRKEAVELFQTNNNTRVFIGNIKAAGVGITLTAASTLAFIEFDWTPGSHLQAEKRPHRIGTKHPVNIYYLVAKDTIEEPLVKLLQKKQKTISTAIDGEKTAKELDIYDALCKELLQENEG